MDVQTDKQPGAGQKDESNMTLQEKVAIALQATSDIDKKMKEIDEKFKQLNVAAANAMRGMLGISAAPPKTDISKMRLKTPTMEGIVEMIQSGKCRKVAFLNGAGISVVSGIPDFRSKGGMYDTLKPESLSATEEQQDNMYAVPTYALSQELFMENPLPFLEVKRPFILGTHAKSWKPTLFHFLARLFYDKQMLRHVFTQNIDGLDYCSSIPDEYITSVHGSMAKISCEACGAPTNYDQFCEHVKNNVRDIHNNPSTGPDVSTPMVCPNCGKPYCKPSIVLFGGSMPDKFKTNGSQESLAEVDLLIVAGTSLNVSPANTIVNQVAPECARLIFNREPVGRDLGIQYGPGSIRDVFCQGDCDEGALKLITKLGWQKDLLRFKKDMCSTSQSALTQLEIENSTRK